MANINEMSIDSLLYNFRNRMQILLIDEARKHQMDAQPGWVIDLIEDENACGRQVTGSQTAKLWRTILAGLTMAADEMVHRSLHQGPVRGD